MLKTKYFSFIASITIFTFLFASCTNENSEAKLENIQFEKTISSVPGDKVDIVLSDTIFHNYLLENDKFLANIVDAEKAQEILDRANNQTLNQANSNSFAQYLGKANYSSLYRHMYVQQQRIIVLNQKYNLSNFTESEMLDLGTRGQIQLNIPSDDNIVAYKDCAGRYSNCRVKAGAIYFLGAAGCVGGSSLVAGGSGGALSGPAAWVASICLSANAVYYATNLNDCRYAYEDCLHS